jgi:acetyl-CoA carboxylase biotin carboxyl carrier protein
MSAKIDYKEINKLVKFMEEKKLSHFELEVEDLKIKINRNPSPLLPSETIPAAQETEESEVNESVQSQEAEPEKGKNNLFFIISPMVGTFYRTPDPSSSPFVEVGDPVKKNQTLCIIEAMKLMNEIESEVNGTLEEIYVENGKAVEYGQKLFSIKPLP